MFVYINHSLVCEKCASAGIPDRCVHAMQFLPPWKSYFQLKAIQSMSSRKEKAALMEEIFGIVGREAEGAPLSSPHSPRTAHSPCPRL